MGELEVEEEVARRRENRRRATERRYSARRGESQLSRNARAQIRAAVLRAGKSSRDAVNGVLARYSKIDDTPVFILKAIKYSPFVQDARRRQVMWEQRMGIAEESEGTRRLVGTRG